MAFALIAIGLLLFVAAYFNNVGALGTQLKDDMVGSRGFMIWVVALFIVGAIGYVPQLRTVSRAFMALILVVVFLTNGGIFERLSETLGAPADKPEDAPTNPNEAPDAAEPEAEK